MSVPANELSRRDLLRGRTMAESGHISSLLITAHPDRLSEVVSAIGQIAGAEVALSDPSGKIIVTLETPGDAEIVSGLNRIQTLPGVVSAALVFHQVDTEEPDDGS